MKHIVTVGIRDSGYERKRQNANQQRFDSYNQQLGELVDLPKLLHKIGARMSVIEAIDVRRLMATFESFKARNRYP